MRLFDDTTAPFKKLLVANRGEIAVRVIRACQDLGIGSVALYSDVDRSALHVRLADEAWPLGGSQASESYLDIDKILGVASRSGAAAVHPGYGFLAESAELARAVSEAGLVWVGPSPESIKLAGDKLEARRKMSEAGVNVVPGSELLASEAELNRAVEAVGLPVMIKAAAGGGGKGMRLVRDAAELASAFRAARSEARSFFGNDAVYIERLIESPRHIEVQVLADGEGRVLHFGERECSVQRRHQKVVEEAPSPLVDAEMRERLGSQAVAAARAVDYVNAGTVEFIADTHGQFFFLEMNTRIQVEHPITEMITGADLVKAQILIAGGRRLVLEQPDVRFAGHALECRIYAEDPARNFMPSPGTISGFRVPEGPGVRHDSGVTDGSQVPVEYDPILSKLIVWGADRCEAVARMKRALNEFRIGGVVTNIPLHLRVLHDEGFVSGRYDTGLLSEEFMGQAAEPDLGFEQAAAVAAALASSRERPQNGSSSRAPSPWLMAGRRAATTNRL